MVLASGTGTLFHALLDAAAVPDFPAQVVALFVDRPCAAEQLAADAGLPSVRLEPGADRTSWNLALRDLVAEYHPDWIISAGFMRVLGPGFLTEFAGRVINTHPSLLPAFGGAHGVRDALEYGVKITGCTIHLVDEGVDTGPILAQRALAVEPEDDEASLHERIKVLEREQLVDTVARLATGKVVVNGRKAVITRG